MTKHVLSLFFVFTLTAASVTHATYNHEGAWELGLGIGTHHPFAGDKYQENNSTGNGYNYWLGYGLTPNWGVELAYDYLDFDGTNAENKFYTLAAVYKYNTEMHIYPIAKLGLSATDFSIQDRESRSSFGAKASVGIQSDFKYASIGALVNFFYAAKSDKAQDLENVQSVQPGLFVAFHYPWTNHSCNCSDESGTASQITEAKILDTDKDGVVDSEDKCPNTAAGSKVNSYGCIETEKVSLTIQVQFVPGSAKLEGSSNSEIQKFADFMKNHPKTSVQINGYTDNTGSPGLNKKLSLNRANAVKAALVSEGIESSRMKTQGFGSENPIADNSTEEGRKLNRRVSVELSEKN